MTGPGGGKIQAKAYSAAQTAGTAQSPLDWGDQCFLCSRSINIDTPPVEAREFYVGKNGMYLCHSSCIAEMNAAGGTPRDFHMARQAAGKPAVEPEPEQVTIAPPVRKQGAGWLHFETLADYNAHVRNNPIGEHVKITVGSQLLQAGE